MYHCLKSVPFLQKLPHHHYKRIVDIAKVRMFRKGELIFRQEESGQHLFVVLTGTVKIFVTSSGQRRKTLAMLERGDFFGEMSLLDGRVRSANAMAVSPSKILMIHKKDFKDLLAANPKLMFCVLRTLTERLREADEQISALLFKNVHGRVIKTIVDLSEGGRQVNGALLLPRPMTRQELAEIVGTTREPVSRSLAMLRRAGLIEYRGKNIAIRDVERMRGLL